MSDAERQQPEIRALLEQVLARLSAIEARLPRQQLVSVKEAAACWGISESSVWRRIKEGTVVPERKGSRVLVDISAGASGSSIGPSLVPSVAPSNDNAEPVDVALLAWKARRR